jgi:hypothetical protein
MTFKPAQFEEFFETGFLWDPQANPETILAAANTIDEFVEHSP